MKLLLTADRVGGVWTYATELAGALGPLGVEVVVAVLGPSPSHSPAEGFTVIDTDGPAAVRAAAGAIAALAGEIGADLVHLNSPTLAAARYPCPVIAVDHGTIAPWWQAAHGPPLRAALANLRG